jgi:hypothetical protein
MSDCRGERRLAGGFRAGSGREFAGRGGAFFGDPDRSLCAATDNALREVDAAGDLCGRCVRRIERVRPGACGLAGADASGRRENAARILIPGRSLPSSD